MLLANTNNRKATELKDFHGFAAARDALSWPDRRRGLSNFLTWSFFLAEIVAADLFFGKGASAADALDDPTTHAATDPRASGDDSANLDWRTGTNDAVQEDASERGFHLQLAALNPQSPGTAAHPALTGVGDGPSAHDASFGGSGGGGGPSAENASDALAIGSPSTTDDAGLSSFDVGAENAGIVGLEPGLAAELGLDLNPISFDIELDASLLSGTSLDLTLDLDGIGLNFASNLLPDLNVEGLGDALGTIGLGLTSLTGLIGGASAAENELGPILTDTASTLVNTVADVSSQILGLSGDLASGGVFGVLPSIDLPETDQLFTGGQYTEYNLALQTEGGSGAVVAIGGELSADSAVLVHASADLAGLGEHIIDATLAGPDHEIALRDLSL